MRREIKPFMVSQEQIEDYQFTKAQEAAYESLKKAVKRCEKSGLSLFGKQWHLVAYPTKFHMNCMLDNSSEETYKKIEAPSLTGASLCDSGADDTMYILDKYIKD